MTTNTHNGRWSHRLGRGAGRAWRGYLRREQRVAGRLAPRGVRLSNVTPRFISSLRIVRDSGDYSMWSRRAARPKCSSSATAMKQRRWRKFMFAPY